MKELTSTTGVLRNMQKERFCSPKRKTQPKPNYSRVEYVHRIFFTIGYYLVFGSRNETCTIDNYLETRVVRFFCVLVL